MVVLVALDEKRPEDIRELLVEEDGGGNVRCGICMRFCVCVCQVWRVSPREYGYIINLSLFSLHSRMFRVRPTGDGCLLLGLLFVSVFSPSGNI
jgi:hypothetical protein